MEGNEYSIYPNPTSSAFVLIAPEGETNLEVEIYNSNGQKVYEEISNSNQEINADLSSGVYFVSIKSNEGIRTLKLVKN